MSLSNLINQRADGDRQTAIKSEDLKRLIVSIEQELFPNLTISSIHAHHPVVVQQIPDS